MMFRSLATGASGMEAEQTKLDVTANNIANVSTNGFKRGRAEFADLIYQQTRGAGAATGAGTMAPAATEIGLGTRLTSTAREHSQGQLNNTGNQLDVAIEGKGFLPVTMPNGTTQYTRNGALQMTAEGKLVTSDGYAVGGDITIPPDAQSVTIAADGTVTVSTPTDVTATTVGQIQIANFANPGGLEGQGGNLFRETAASGTAVLGNPGEGGAGNLRQGMLEGSNVNVVEEMVDLISGQRAYEVNSRVIKAADEMLAETAQLH
jgi:flagellar basal-body rod protein FlgG